MKIYLKFCLVGIFLICINCKNEKSVKTKKKDISVKSIIQSDKVHYDYENVVLQKSIIDSTSAIFSNEIEKDLFVVEVEKGRINDTKTSITIINRQGKKLYEHIFPTRELINGYNITEINNNPEMEMYVIGQAMKILKDGIINPNKLSADDFLQTSPKENFDNYDVFEEIKLSNRNIFIYGLEEENLYFLGYSKKENKMVTIISCC